MTVFLLLSSALALLAIACLTRPLWWRRRATADAALPRSAGLAVALGVFVVAFAATGYAVVGAPHRLAPGAGSAMPPPGAISREQVEAVVERALQSAASAAADR